MVDSLIFDEIMDLYLRYSNKYNLVNSACLELFKIINDSDIKRIIIYINDRYKEKIEVIYNKIWPSELEYDYIVTKFGESFRENISKIPVLSTRYYQFL